MDSCLYGLSIAFFLMKPQSKTEFMGKVMSCYNLEKADITRFGKMKRAILLLSILMLPPKKESSYNVRNQIKRGDLDGKEGLHTGTDY